MDKWRVPDCFQLSPASRLKYLKYKFQYYYSISNVIIRRHLLYSSPLIFETMLNQYFFRNIMIEHIFGNLETKTRYKLQALKIKRNDRKTS